MDNIKLTGYRIKKISAERNVNFNGKITLKTNISIKNIEKLEEHEDTIKVDYSFEVDYGDLGDIFIEGLIFFTGNSKNIENLLKSWKEKKFDNQEQVAITNTILAKASVKAFELEEELGLPLHIKLPLIELKNNK